MKNEFSFYTIAKEEAIKNIEGERAILENIRGQFSPATKSDKGYMTTNFKTTVLLAIALSIMLIACERKPLPILGAPKVISKEVDGRTVADSIPHTIPDFAFINQDSNQVTADTFKNKIYVADFFFATCPSICPIMKTQMLRVYKKYENNPDVLILSHTIDPEHDSVPVLNDYAASINVSSKKWHFVTGPQDKIFEIGQNSYMVSATKDPNEPRGVIHSGAFILVDKQRRVRGIYDGTKKKEVGQLLEDIDLLIKEG